MNYCDANGKCKGGKGCSVGEPLPIQMHDDPANEGAPTLMEAFSIVTLVVLLIGLGFFAGRLTA